MAKVEEPLPRNCESLSLNPTTAKRKKKKNKKISFSSDKEYGKHVFI
jgi:hypothetical protein